MDLIGGSKALWMDLPGPSWRSDQQQALYISRKSIGAVPIAPHIPIRQRLSNSSRRNSSVDVDSSANVFGRSNRRMSLLQTLREQNRQRSRRQSDESDHEPTQEVIRRSTMASSPQRKTEKKSRKVSAPHLTTPKVIITTRKGDMSPRTRPDRLPVFRFFSMETKGNEQEIRVEHDHRPWSCSNLPKPKDQVAKSQRSDSTTNNSPVNKDQLQPATASKIRSASLPNLCDPPESYTDHSLSFSSPTSYKSSVNPLSNNLSPALSPRFICSPPEPDETYKFDELKKALRQQHQQDSNNNHHPQLSFEDEFPLLLDRYLPFISDYDVHSSPSPSRPASSLNTLIGIDNPQHQKQSHSHSHRLDTPVQTDLSLMRIGDKLNGYLSDLQQMKCHQQPDGNGSNDQGMNFLAKHFFEYQSFINVPDKGIRLHKTPASHAGVDQAAAWGPKSLVKTGKHQPAPQARSSRNNMEVTHKYRPVGKHHDHREWGDRHGELKPEKVAHKDLWSKFLSGEDTTIRDVFNSEFEDNLLQTEPDTIVDVLKQSDAVDTDFVMGALSNKKSPMNTEILTILTYAPTVQFVTATIKKAKSLPFNNNPFARVLLFEGRRLLEQKQTTITTGVGNFAFRQNKDAIFSESFLFHMPPMRLGHCHVVIEIYDRQPSDNQPLPIGHVVLGPLCPGQGSLHWHQMIRKQGFPICMWHRLTQ